MLSLAFRCEPADVQLVPADNGAVLQSQRKPAQRGDDRHRAHARFALLQSHRRVPAHACASLPQHALSSEASAPSAMVHATQQTLPVWAVHDVRSRSLACSVLQSAASVLSSINENAHTLHPRCAVMYLYQIYQNNMAPTVLGLFPMFVGAVSVDGAPIALARTNASTIACDMPHENAAGAVCYFAASVLRLQQDEYVAGPELAACPPKLRQVYADFRLAQVCKPLPWQLTRLVGLRRRLAYYGTLSQSSLCCRRNGRLGPQGYCAAGQDDVFPRAPHAKRRQHRTNAQGIVEGESASSWQPMMCLAQRFILFSLSTPLYLFKHTACHGCHGCPTVSLLACRLSRTRW